MRGLWKQQYGGAKRFLTFEEEPEVQGDGGGGNRCVAAPQMQRGTAKSSGLLAFSFNNKPFFGLENILGPLDASFVSEIQF